MFTFICVSPSSLKSPFCPLVRASFAGEEEIGASPLDVYHLLHRLQKHQVLCHLTQIRFYCNFAVCLRFVEKLIVGWAKNGNFIEVQQPKELEEGESDVVTAEGKGPDLQTLFRRFLKVAAPYWSSDDKVQARLQLAGVFALTLATTGISVGFNFLGRDFYNALASKLTYTLYLI